MINDDDKCDQIDDDKCDQIDDDKCDQIDDDKCDQIDKKVIKNLQILRYLYYINNEWLIMGE